MENTRLIRPGILVALKTSVTGGAHYDRQDIDSTPDGTVARWETTRRMEDPQEHKRAGQMLGLITWPIDKLCIRTTFGKICPLDREAELDTAIAAARLAVDAWNAKARTTFLTVNVLKGRIADNDEEAIRALLAEARELLDRMDDGLRSGDVKAIREAAVRAQRLAGMMDDDSATDVTAAVTGARAAAREIVRRTKDEGTEALEIVASVSRAAFDSARFSFLEAAEAEVAALPAVDVQRMAEIEAFRQERIESRRPAVLGEEVD